MVKQNAVLTKWVLSPLNMKNLMAGISCAII